MPLPEAHSPVSQVVLTASPRARLAQEFVVAWKQLCWALLLSFRDAVDSEQSQQPWPARMVVAAFWRPLLPSTQWSPVAW